VAVKICPQVYQVGGDNLSHPDDCCVYLVESENKLSRLSFTRPKNWSAFRVENDRMATDQNNQQEIFRILNNLSEDYKAFYPFNEEYITTYRYEILAIKSYDGHVV